MAIANDSNCLEEVRATLDILETSLDGCPTLVPLSREYPHLPSRSDTSPINYAAKVKKRKN